MSYWLTRLFFIRGLGSLYIIMGSILFFQGPSLIGENGLHPLSDIIAGLNSRGEELPLWSSPSVFWWLASNEIILTMAVIMILLGAILVAGYCNIIVLFILWGCQLSLVNAGSPFFAFGWETMMLEMTFLSCFFIHPWRLNLLSEKNFIPQYWSFFPLIWLLFRLILGAGLIKIRGDHCWLDLTCMDYHYQTQPNPHPLSWFYHQAPRWFHRAEVLFTHFSELLVPFLFLGPQKIRRVGGIIIIIFQMILMSTGNLAFINWQTLVLSLVVFDDSFFKPFVFSQTQSKIKKLENLKPSLLFQRITFCALFVIALLSYQPIKNLFSSEQRMNQSYNQFHLINSYGLFGSITQKRFEVVISASNEKKLSPTTAWREYNFYCKPSALDQRPCLITPYHLRLDWQMWFSAMRPQLQEPWLARLAEKILKGDPVVEKLLIQDPFHGEDRPIWIKMDLYEYKFAPPGYSGWWEREWVQIYLKPSRLGL